MSRLAAGLIMAGLAACTPKGGPPPTLDPAGLSSEASPTSAASLTSVPFHPQSERTDCGPAALAMMLGWTGLDTNPKALAPAVYTPGREGTLQTDIVQATRRAGRLAAPVRDFRNLLAELDAGNPVLVLQNLGIERWPLWHYAVAVGYDLNAATLFLHSGKQARLETSFSDFEKSWRSSKHWGLTITPCQAGCPPPCDWLTVSKRQMVLSKPARQMRRRRPTAHFWRAGRTALPP